MKFLYEAIPLVTSQALGDFSEPLLIGHHYGDLRRTRIRCIKITPQVWLVGAHPWLSVDGCWVGDKRTIAFEPFVQEDNDGAMRQYIRLSQPPASDAFTVEVSGRGKVSSVTGLLMENPDVIIEDITALSGRPLTFPFFREACYKRDLKIAGSVHEDRTFRSVIAEIVESCGARWAGAEVFFPLEDFTYTKAIPAIGSSSYTLDSLDVCGVIDVYYSWNQSRGWNGAHLQMEARGCRYSNSGVLYAKWLRQAKDAERLVREALRVRAGEFVDVTATVPGLYNAGEMVEISGDNFSGPFRILAAQQTPVETTIEGRIVLSLYANLRLTHFTQEIPLTRSERIDVALYPNNVVEITVFDQQNRILSGIFVTIDNKVTLRTDARGLVSLTLSSGDHLIILSGENIDNSDPFPLSIP